MEKSTAYSGAYTWPTRKAAQEWLENSGIGKGTYYLSHNECAPPNYKVVKVRGCNAYVIKVTYKFLGYYETIHYLTDDDIAEQDSIDNFEITVRAISDNANRMDTVAIHS